MNISRRGLLKCGGVVLASSPVLSILALSTSAPGLLEEQRRAARREGVPLTPDDLRPSPPIPDSQNAGPLIKELTQRYNALPEKERHDWELLGAELAKKPDDPSLREQFHAGEQRYAALIALAEDAVKRPSCDLAYDWSLGPKLLLPELAILRQFARVFHSRALIAPDAASAWADIARAAKLGNLIAQTPTLIAALVYAAIHGIADRGYIETLKRFGSSPEAHKTLAAFAPPPAPTFYLGSEVILGTATLQLLRKGESVEPTINPSFNRPSVMAPILLNFWEKQLLAFWRETFAVLRHGSQDHYATEQHQLDVILHRWSEDRLGRVQNQMVSVLAPKVSDALRKTHVQTVTLRILRESATALLEHKARTGTFPEALTPLPTDPFSGKGLVYRRDGAGCVLYSVGPNQTDDGGVEKRPKSSERLDITVRL